VRDDREPQPLPARDIPTAQPEGIQQAPMEEAEGMQDEMPSMPTPDVAPAAMGEPQMGASEYEPVPQSSLVDVGQYLPPEQRRQPQALEPRQEPQAQPDRPIEDLQPRQDIPIEDTGLLDIIPKIKPMGVLSKSNDDIHRQLLKEQIEADTGIPEPEQATLEELADKDAQLEQEAAVNLAIDPAEQNADQYVAIAQETEAKKGLPWSPYNPFGNFVAQYSSPEEERAALAAEQYMRQSTMNLLDDIGIGEHIGAIAKMLIPLESTKERLTSFGTIFARDAFAQIIADFHASPPEEQMVKYEYMKRWLLEESDFERPEVANMLLQLTDPLEPDLSDFSAWWAA